MTSPFSRLHHLCVAVHDIDEAVRFYESVGIGPWHDYPPLSAFTELEGVDREDFGRLVYRYAWIGDVQLQLVQPGPEATRQRRFLEAHGQGVFHVGFEVDDADAGQAAATEMGMDVLMSGRRDDGSGFTYFDTAERAGVILEIRQSPPA